MRAHFLHLIRWNKDPDLGKVVSASMVRSREEGMTSESTALCLRRNNRWDSGQEAWGFCDEPRSGGRASYRKHAKMIGMKYGHILPNYKLPWKLPLKC